MMDMAVDTHSTAGLGSSNTAAAAASSSVSIPMSNIGFQLLKKHGWKEGTGLGVSEQGRLEPVEVVVKKNKRGLGADKPKKTVDHTKNHDGGDPKLPKKKARGMSKKLKKIQDHEKQLQERNSIGLFSWSFGQIMFEFVASLNTAAFDMHICSI